jgi:hypothetical protein
MQKYKKSANKMYIMCKIERETWKIEEKCVNLRSEK